jgi:hypothetical protein
LCVEDTLDRLGPSARMSSSSRSASHTKKPRASVSSR